MAGIAGNNSNITSCANYGRISTPSDFVGSTAGIIGVVYKNKNGLVTNSYNVGDITGNENGLFGIGKVGSKKNQGKIENSYYVCKLNGAEIMPLRPKSSTTKWTRPTQLAMTLRCW